VTAAETMPPLTEKAFQAQVVELAKILGWRVYHPFLSKWSERGFPDLTMVRARDRRLVFAELKGDRGKVTEAQAEWQELLGRVSQGPMLCGEGPHGRARPEPRLDCCPPMIEVFVWRPADWDTIEQVLR
jgi:hypothetical protein